MKDYSNEAERIELHGDEGVFSFKLDYSSWTYRVFHLVDTTFCVAWRQVGFLKHKSHESNAALYRRGVELFEKTY